MKPFFIVLGLLLTPITFADTTAPAVPVDRKPLAIRIANEHQVSVALSNQDINRVVVAHDKITRVNAPAHRLVAHNDPSGALFVNVIGSAPFSAFITTEHGRTFSLFVLPKSEPGVTLRFIPTTPVARHTPPPPSHATERVESSSSYQQTLIQLIRDMVLQRIPPGYSAIAPRAFVHVAALAVPRYLLRKRFLSEQVVAGFLGGALAVRIVRVTNRSRHHVTLVAREFYAPGVRAVAIATPTVAPRQSTLLYEVVSND